VQVAQRWILARLRNQRFFSLTDLNAAIRRLLDELNMRVMRGYGASRADLFATIDRPNLQPLPPEPYKFARWKRARVAPDYHVEVDSSWYSVPFGLIRQQVDVRVCGSIVEIFHRGQRVASHPRCPGRRSHVTVPEHMPSAHRRHAEWTPARVLVQAAKLGPSVTAFCEAVMADRPHPEQGFRSCLGVLALARSYEPIRLDAACRRGLSIRARSVASIRSILKNGLDSAFLEEDPEQLPLQHQNIRGQGYYH
jgi:transposase